MPSRLRIRCLTISNEATYEKIALTLQKQLYEIGVDLEIETLPGRELLSRISSGQFDTILVERTSGRSLAWTYLSFHSSESPSGYTAADKVLDRLRSTTNEGAIRAAVSDLQQILFDDPPAIFIAWPKVARVVSSKFAVPSAADPSNNEAGRDVLSSLWQWQPAETRR
jgi:ABC-type transport system substrate-binding protein